MTTDPIREAARLARQLRARNTDDGPKSYTDRTAIDDHKAADILAALAQPRPEQVEDEATAVTCPDCGGAGEFFDGCICRSCGGSGRAIVARPAPKPAGWLDPLDSPQAQAIRSGKIDDTEIRNLFDQMERELRLHRERFRTAPKPAGDK